MKQTKINSIFKIQSKSTLQNETKRENNDISLPNIHNQNNNNINTETFIDDNKLPTIDKYIMYFDGCSKGNPGESGAGAVIYKNNEEIWSRSVFVGEKSTNNAAEYTGLLIGLNEAVKLGIKILHVKGDSLLVIKQMKNEYKINSKSMKEYYKLARDLSNKFDSIIFTHVYREFNKRADDLSNQGLCKNPKHKLI
jgi:ribonuclease HI